MEKRKLIVAIPKGSLQEHTVRVFRAAGLELQLSVRGYHILTSDPEMECMLLRAQEIPRYVAEGKFAAGITGADWIQAAGVRVQEVADLRYSKQGITKIKWVLAVPEDSPITSVRDLEGKTIAAEGVEIAKEYFKRKKVNAKIEFSWGATEAKPPRIVDAIIDTTETGQSLKANRLKVLDVVFESSTKLIANRHAWENPWVQEKVKDLGMLLEGAVKGEEIVNLLFHVPRNKILEVLPLVPVLKAPTIRELVNKGWSDMEISSEKKAVRKLLPQLKRMGCEGIVEFPVNMFVR